MDLIYFVDLALPPGYAHRSGPVQQLVVYTSSLYNGAISRYLALSTAFSMKRHKF